MLKGVIGYSQKFLHFGYLLCFWNFLLAEVQEPLSKRLQSVEHELARLVRAKNLDDFWSEKFSQINLLHEPLLNFINKNVFFQQGVCTKIFFQSLADLRLLCGDEDFEQESVLHKISDAQTSVGHILLATTLANPIFDLTRLERRKSLIKLLGKDSFLKTELTSLVDQFGKILPTFVRIFTATPDLDPTCLLNPEFSLYWKDKSPLALVPKKASKRFKTVVNQNIVKSKNAKSWLKVFDRSKNLLTIGFGITTFMLISNWFAQVTNCTRKFEDVFQFKLLSKFIEYFSIPDDAELAHALPSGISGDSSINELINLDSEQQARVASALLAQAKQKAKAHLTPFAIGLTKEKEKIQTSLQKKKILAFFTHSIRLANGVMKPFYLCLAPPIILSNIYRQSEQWKLGLKRALHELEQISELVFLSEKLLEILRAAFADNASLLENFAELDLLQQVKDLFDTEKNKKFFALISTLKQYKNQHFKLFLISPGRFLQVYKELYEKLPYFFGIIAAFGQLDAFLAAARLAKKPEYCLPEFNSDQIIKIENCWNPKIGCNDCIPNSLNFDQAFKGMLISGPNAAGKSSFMSSMMCAVIMAQSLCVVPASFADICPVNKFFVAMNKHDDPAQGRSLYKVETLLIADLLNKIKCLTPSERMLVAVDEMFSSTNEVDARALTWSVISEIAQFPQVNSMIASHCSGIFGLEDFTKRVFQNYKAVVNRDENGKFISYARKIIPGCAARHDSTAMDVAAQSGIPSHVLEKAKTLIVED